MIHLIKFDYSQQNCPTELKKNTSDKCFGGTQGGSFMRFKEARFYFYQQKAYKYQDKE